jgi:hypothetical protein
VLQAGAPTPSRPRRGGSPVPPTDCEPLF